MRVVIITGGLGSGKSALVRELVGLGADRLDTDAISHELLEGDAAYRQELVDAFGERILGSDGAVCAPLLAAAAFADEQSAQLLNSISFPHIMREVSRRIEECAGQEGVLLVEVPLLAEAPEFAELADEVIAVEAPEALRVARAVGRGMAEADACARIARQASDAQRRVLATAVCNNAGSLAELRAWALSWWDERGLS